MHALHERRNKVQGARWPELSVTRNSCSHLPHTLHTHPTPLDSYPFSSAPFLPHTPHLIGGLHKLELNARLEGLAH